MRSLLDGDHSECDKLHAGNKSLEKHKYMQSMAFHVHHRMFGGPDSDVLMEVSVPVWSQKDCQGAYIERIADAMVCAGAKEGGRDSCQVTGPFFNYYLPINS